MFGSAILDVAIGIVFVFLLLSVFASTINEMILSYMNMRGKELFDGLKMLLNDPDATGLVDKLYNHGQIYGLFKGPFDPKKLDNLPSYIPTENFVLALLDVIPDQAASAPAPQAAPAPPPQGRPADALQAAPPPPAQQAAPAPPPQGRPADALQAAPPPPAPQAAPAPPPLQGQPADAQQAAPPPPAQQAAPPPPPAQPAPAQQAAADPFANLRAAAQVLAKKEPKVGKPVLAMINAAGTDAAKLQKSLEDWYNNAMDRVSGWYKYRTQKLLFVIGLILAVFLNANTIKIVKQLSTDSTLRQSIVAAAGAAKLPESKPGDQTIADQMAQAKQQVSSIENLGIPLGWEDTVVSRFKSELPNWKRWIWIWLEDLLGWVMTALAISLGAPFWFDMLNKIMTVRSTIKPGEKPQAPSQSQPPQQQQPG